MDEYFYYFQHITEWSRWNKATLKNCL